MDSQEKYRTQFKVLSTGDNILPAPLQASVEKIVEKEGYLTHKILCRSISTNGGNYMGDLYEVDIKGKTTNGEKKTDVFIKYKIEDSKLALLDTDECYGNEIFFYGQLSKIYEDMQNKANIPPEERYAIVKSFDTSNPNAIILENLHKKGFTTFHRMEVPPLRFMELSIQQLARFHGLSWVLEKQRPEYFTKNIKNMRSNFKFNNEYQDFIDNMSKHTGKIVDEETKPKYKKLQTRMLEIMRQCYNENAGVRCCLCHGDFRVNNILMKNDGDNITDVIPVDYQLLFYGCPVMDFHFFIVLATDSEFRRKHLDNLKDLYHDSLAKFLTYFGMDVDSVYPRDEFEKDYSKRLDYSLTTGLLMLPVLFTNDIPDINNDNMASITLTPDSKMDERIRGLLDDFKKWGVL